MRLNIDLLFAPELFNKPLRKIEIHKIPKLISPILIKLETYSTDKNPKIIKITPIINNPKFLFLEILLNKYLFL